MTVKFFWQKKIVYVVVVVFLPIINMEFFPMKSEDPPTLQKQNIPDLNQVDWAETRYMNIYTDKF